MDSICKKATGDCHIPILHFYCTFRISNSRRLSSGIKNPITIHNSSLPFTFQSHKDVPNTIPSFLLKHCQLKAE